MGWHNQTKERSKSNKTNPRNKQFNKVIRFGKTDTCRNVKKRLSDLEFQVAAPGEKKLFFIYKDILKNMKAIMNRKRHKSDKENGVDNPPPKRQKEGT